VDFEFLVQLLQLRHGHALPALRQPGTRRGCAPWRMPALSRPGSPTQLLASYNFLKRIEILLRATRQGRERPGRLLRGARPLACWLGFADEASFWTEYCHRLAETRRMVQALLPPGVNLV